MKNIREYIHEILSLLKEDRRKLPALVLLFIGVSLLDIAGLGLIAPYIGLVMGANQFTDGGIGRSLAMLNLNLDRETLLIWLSGLLVILFIGKAVAALWINNVIITFAHSQESRLRSQLMLNYLHLPYSIYLQRNSSEYIHSVQTLTAHFQGVVQQLLRTVSDGLVAVCIIGLLIWENAAALSLLMLLVGGTLVTYDRFFRRRLKNYGIRQNQALQRMVKGIQEGMEGLKEIRILGREAHFHNQVGLSAEDYSINQRLYQLISLAPSYMLEATLVIFVVLLVLLTLSLETSTTVLLGSLGLFGVAALRLKPIAFQLSNTISTLRFHRDGVRRLYADAKYIKEKINRSDKLIKAGEPYDSINPNGQIVEKVEPFSCLKLDNVQFSYPKTNLPALKSMSLEIQAGEAIGLIGPSGSGKTTLVDVLLGLLTPQSGTLKFNGRDLQESLDAWRSQVAYLPQQVFLIDNTLKNNVALGEEERKIEEDQMKEALRKARLNELVVQLPQGVNTFLGERGVSLSGGQRQRVALARAFYYRRSVLVMDEATSSLDYLAEKEIVEEIKHLKGKITMIVIAHRFTTVQHCDRIYRLENGRVVEKGTPQQVLSLAS